MKKLILMLVAGAIAGVFVTGCSQPAEGNTEPSSTTPEKSTAATTAPEANAPAANAPEMSGAGAAGATVAAGANTPPEDKK